MQTDAGLVEIRMPPHGRHPTGHLELRSNLVGCLLVLRVSVQHEVAYPLLRADVRNGPQQREAAAFTVDGVLAGGKGDVAATPAAPLPHAEADEFKPSSTPSVKCSSASASLPGGLCLSFGTILTTMMCPPEMLASAASG